MKAFILVLFLIAGSYVPGKEKDYTASTPASRTIRHFLGINPADSIDFIRWKLNFSDQNEFKLICSYGISKPNTNGFIDEKEVEIKGSLAKQDNLYTLSAGGRSLSMIELDQNLLHILNEDKSMMVGNGGWSYTLNSIRVIPVTEIRVKPNKWGFSDSITYEGRTPCKVLDQKLNNRISPTCYKMKWLVKLYKAGPSATTGTYKMGSRQDRRGTWKLKEDNNGRIIYSLDMANGHELNLLQTDENILYFLDSDGRILVGDLDFSYSLNRRMGKTRNN